MSDWEMILKEFTNTQEPYVPFAERFDFLMGQFDKILSKDNLIVEGELYRWPGSFVVAQSHLISQEKRSA